MKKQPTVGSLLQQTTLKCYEISFPDQFQGYCTAIIWESSEGTLLIATCYFPPPPNSKYYLEPFRICQLMDFLSNCNANHRIINGDFNLSSIDWSIQTSEPLHQCILDKIDKLSLTQTVHFKTTNANILDLVLVSNQVEIIDTLPLDVFTAPKSDHKPINSKIRIKELEKNSTFSKTSFYSYCKADFNGLNEAFSINTLSPYCWSNVTKIVELWYEWIHSFLPKFIPRRTQHRQNLPPWITPET